VKEARLMQARSIVMRLEVGGPLLLRFCEFTGFVRVKVSSAASMSQDICRRPIFAHFQNIATKYISPKSGSRVSPKNAAFMVC